MDLRKLHRELESKRQFGNWAKSRLSQFTEGEDFASLHNIVERETGASRRKDYTVTIDCAKNIAMMEKTERGKEVRKYFIKCETALMARSTLAAPAIPQTYLEAMRAHLCSLEKNEAQARLLDRQQPSSLS